MSKNGFITGIEQRSQQAHKYNNAAGEKRHAAKYPTSKRMWGKQRVTVDSGGTLRGAGGMHLREGQQVTIDSCSVFHPHPGASGQCWPMQVTISGTLANANSSTVTVNYEQRGRLFSRKVTREMTPESLQRSMDAALKINSKSKRSGRYAEEHVSKQGAIPEPTPVEWEPVVDPIDIQINELIQMVRTGKRR